MKHPHRYLLAALVLGCIVYATAGCAASPGQVQELTSLWQQITADGLISPEEAAAFQAKLWDTLSSVNWAETVGLLVGSVVSSIVGTNVLRNRRERKLWGTPESPKPTSPTPVASTPS